MRRDSTQRLLLTFGTTLCLSPYLYSIPRQSTQAKQVLTQTEQAAKADETYQAKNWPEAARLYGAITEAQPKNARAWYRLATSLHGLGKQDEAIAAYQECLQAGGPAGAAEYAIGLAYASQRDTENSFKYLQKSAEDGFSDMRRLNSDEELTALRSDGRFAKVVKQAAHNLKPCAYNTLNRQFDFWVGEWQVVTADGATPAGDSKIELILGDCVIQENWTSAGNIGYEGRSYNIYNADLHRWEQFWNDNSGGMIHFYGNLKDGVMDYYTDEIPQKDGTKLKRHLQFIPLAPDKLRQFSQGSTDGGKTWNVEYDLIYDRKK